MTRALTATVIIVVLLGSLSLAWPAFAALALLALLFAWHEFVRLAKDAGAQPVAAPGALLALACALSFAAPDPAAPMTMLLIAILLTALAALRDHYGDAPGVAASLAATLAGIAWLALPLGAQIAIRRMDQGATWLVLVYATVAIGDSAAYYGGSTLGRRRLAPSLSPNKTVEGAVFGLAGSAGAAAVVSNWLPGLPAERAALLGLALGFVGQFGDLVESALKRAAGHKDSSDLLPGHGGVLDRVDAHLPAGVLLYVALRAGWLF